MEDYREKLKENINEYALVFAMTEEAVCEYMNANSKEDALEAIQCEIDYYRSKVEEKMEESDWRTAGLDPAFASWEEVNSMFV